jgi:hypothetical protein
MKTTDCCFDLAELVVLEVEQRDVLEGQTLSATKMNNKRGRDNKRERETEKYNKREIT